MAQEPAHSDFGKGAVIVTTISPPNAILRQLAEGCAARGMDFIVIGDAKSPADFALSDCAYYSLEAQRALDLETAKQVPTGHYARKNIGYLLAMAGGADFICEIDDDNIPNPPFYEPLPPKAAWPVATAAGWVNVYRYYTGEHIWPRGLPLDAARSDLPELSDPRDILAPIQQGLADDNPDVDAIYRMTGRLPVQFDAGEHRVALSKNGWCPYNSQNTVHFALAFPLLYLPAHCSFRMTDIWRSFVAQRIAWECGWHILFREATVRQERNEHDLMRDFTDEIPGYLANRHIAELLSGLALEQGEEAIPDNLRRCYRVLVEAGHMGEAELPLLEAWLADVANLT